MLRRILSLSGILTLLGALLIVTILIAGALVSEIYQAVETPTDGGAKETKAAGKSGGNGYHEYPRLARSPVILAGAGSSSASPLFLLSPLAAAALFRGSLYGSRIVGGT